MKCTVVKDHLCESTLPMMRLNTELKALHKSEAKIMPTALSAQCGEAEARAELQTVQNKLWESRDSQDELRAKIKMHESCYGELNSAVIKSNDLIKEKSKEVAWLEGQLNEDELRTEEMEWRTMEKRPKKGSLT